MKSLVIAFTILTLFLLPAWANDAEDEKDRAADSAAVLSEMLNAPDAEIPEELLDEAEAIAVIPHVVKGAFGIGGSYGKGLVSVWRQLLFPLPLPQRKMLPEKRLPAIIA